MFGALAQVTVKPLSERSVLDPLFGPVMGLPASVLTKPLVAPALSAFGCEEAGALAAKPVSSADHQRLEEAGYRPKISFGERVVWERPDTGFWVSQEMALHLLETKSKEETREDKRRPRYREWQGGRALERDTARYQLTEARGP